MKVEIWIDFVCPFCYMGERKLELALAEFDHRDEVEVIYRSFQLNMASKDTEGKDIHQVIAEKYRISYDTAKSNNDRIIQSASEVGLNYRFDILKLNSTQLAHTIMQFVARRGKGTKFVNLLFKGYFEEGLDIGDEKSLFAIVSELKLDLEELKEQLENGHLKRKVREDEERAKSLGISSIPHFVINGSHEISGSQSPEYLLDVLKSLY